MNMGSCVLLVLLSFVLMTALSRQAYGYIDPGTGSYIIQVLLAGFVGSMFLLKIFWKSVKLFFVKLLSSKKDAHNDAD